MNSQAFRRPSNSVSIAGRFARIARRTSGLGKEIAPAPVLAIMLLVLALPLETSAQTSLQTLDASRVLEAAASYQYQKRLARKTVAATCYFDPQVESSMRCATRASDPGSDLYAMQQHVKRHASKQCKKAGGKSCKVFWRNGALKFDGLSPETSEKLESIFEAMEEDLPEARLLPNGAGVGAVFRDKFEGVKDYWETQRQRLRGRNLHYAICANEPGIWTSFAMLGGSIAPSNVHGICVVKCDGIAALYSIDGPCYVFYADGEFANAAAEQAVMGTK